MDNDAVFMRKGLNVKELYLSAKGKEHLMKHMIETVKNIRQKRLQDHTKDDNKRQRGVGNTPPGVHNRASKEKKV